ncbi:MAG TPA: surface-adhesin E family protein [Methylotenera sp.]
MNKILMVLILISTPAAAEWTMIQTGDNENVYVDFDSLQKQGNLVTVTTLNDYNFKQQKKELSTQFTELHDCKHKKFKALALSYYSENMAQGDVIDASSFNEPEIVWSDVVKYSVGELKANIICSR